MVSEAKPGSTKKYQLCDNNSWSHPFSDHEEIRFFMEEVTFELKLRMTIYLFTKEKVSEVQQALYISCLAKGKPEALNILFREHKNKIIEQIL